MSALSSPALAEQLSAIMGALTRAAVAEICALVDEGYAALQREVARSRRESEDLRRKLHLIESIVVRGGGGGGSGGGGDAAAAAELLPPRPETPQQQQPDGAGGAGGAAVLLLREELPEVVLIKDEDSDTSDTCEEDSSAPADGGAGAAGAAEAAARSRWPGSDAAERRSSSRRCAGPQPRSAAVYTLDSPRSGDELEAGGSLCSYSSQLDPDPDRDPDLHPLHQDCSLVSPSSSRPTYLSRSPAHRAEVDLSLTWTNRSKGHVTFAPLHESESADGDAFGLKLISVSGSTSTDCQLSEGSGSAFECDDADAATGFAPFRDPVPARSRLCGRAGKRFACPVCSKTYATSQNLDVHMRIHTGERPFSCGQCGKKFTQSAHLTSHLSVHSGERPHACALCSRSFIVKYSLKLHMKKCHPNI